MCQGENIMEDNRREDKNVRWIHGNFDFKCNEFCYYKI